MASEQPWPSPLAGVVSFLAGYENPSRQPFRMRSRRPGKRQSRPR